ncbi:hypothetical protein P8936_14765 [Edaphobacter paludis]|uniref:Uncharacterized protein n=1 Tax=Edaphobacter paludis TaxID=3035702 RepID=A0AAU7D6J7_9BACT
MQAGREIEGDLLGLIKAVLPDPAFTLPTQSSMTKIQHLGMCRFRHIPKRRTPLLSLNQEDNLLMMFIMRRLMGFHFLRTCPDFPGDTYYTGRMQDYPMTRSSGQMWATLPNGDTLPSHSSTAG